MKDVIIQGIEQAYQHLIQMLAEFLPRLVVMLVIVPAGFFIALTLKYILRALLLLPSGARGFGAGDREFSLARRALGGSECGISLAEDAELVSACSGVDPCGFDGTRGDWHRQANGCRGVFDCVWRADAGHGDCFWSGRTAPGSQVSGEASRTEGERKT